jgi:hypothetical protein
LSSQVRDVDKEFGLATTTVNPEDQSFESVEELIYPDDMATAPAIDTPTQKPATDCTHRGADEPINGP